MTGVKCLLCCFNNICNRNLADYNLYLNLRQQRNIHFNTTVHLACTLLDATAHNICHSHTRYTQIIHSLSQSVITVHLCNDNYLINTGSCCRRNFCHRNCGCLLCFGSGNIAVLSQICILVDTHNTIGNIHNGKSCISRG